MGGNGGKDEGADKVGEQDDTPEPYNAQQQPWRRTGQQREHDGERVFGEELLPAQNHNEEAKAVAEAADERTPGGVWNGSANEALGGQRETHRGAGGEARPRESARVPCELTLALFADGFVDDGGADGGALRDLLALAAVEHREKTVVGAGPGVVGGGTTLLLQAFTISVLISVLIGLLLGVPDNGLLPCGCLLATVLMFLPLSAFYVADHCLFPPKG